MSQLIYRDDHQSGTSLQTITTGDGMSTEERFFRLQRYLLAPLIGTEAAKDATDYYETAAPKNPLERLLNPLFFFTQHYFMEEVVIGPEISSRLEGHYVRKELESEANRDEWERAHNTFRDFYKNFHPDVLYAGLTGLALISRRTNNLITGDNQEPVQNKGNNLFILKRGSVLPDEKTDLLYRARAIQEVLEYSLEFYERKAKRDIRTIKDPWEEIRFNIEALILRLDPSAQARYAERAVVDEWVKADPDGYHGKGLFVRSNRENGYVFLTNTMIRDRFQGLAGKEVLIHHQRATDYVPIPEAKLIAILD